MRIVLQYLEILDGWNKDTRPYPLWEINNEEINHNIPGLPKPSQVQHQSGS